MLNRKMFFVSTLFWVLVFGFPISSFAQSMVAVIAPSISTSAEAKNVLQRQGWVSGDLKGADAILVVVRSGLSWPLSSSYRNIGELQRDADGQLNISGDNFHVYIFTINRDLSVIEAKHVSYPAND